METRSAHVETEKLLLVAAKEQMLTQFEQRHLENCEECRELLAMFSRQNFTRRNEADVA